MTRMHDIAIAKCPVPEHPGLFHTFADLPFSAEAYAGFAEKYGHVGGLTGETLPVRLAEWMVEHYAMRVAVTLFDALLDSPVPEDLGSLGLHVEPVMTETGMALPGHMGVTAQVTGMPDDGTGAQFAAPIAVVRAGCSNVELVRTCLIELINTHIAFHSVTPDLTIGDESNSIGLSLSFTPRDLFGAMWLQLLLASSGNHRLRKCSVCGEWWDATAARSHKAVCSDNCRAKQSYRRRRDAEEAATRTASV